MIISKQHHCNRFFLLSLLIFCHFGIFISSAVEPTTAAPTEIHGHDLHHQKNYHDRRFMKRQAPSSTTPATCPRDRTLIAPCTCSNNKTSKNGFPELSCINFDGSSGQIPLNQIFRDLSNYLNAEGQQMIFERLLLVNSQTNTINETIFHGLEFNYLSIYETNLTDIGPDSFNDMEDSMQYLLIKGDSLQNIFPALPRLKLLTTLILNLGTNSFDRVPHNTLVDMPELRRVTMNGVVNVIESNAFVNLTALQLIKVTNQLEKIESDAFIIEYGENADGIDMTTTEAYSLRDSDSNNGSRYSSEDNIPSLRDSNNNDDNSWRDREDSTSSTFPTTKSSGSESNNDNTNRGNNNNFGQGYVRYNENTGNDQNNEATSEDGSSQSVTTDNPSMSNEGNNNNFDNSRSRNSEDKSGSSRNNDFSSNNGEPSSRNQNNGGGSSSFERNNISGGGGFRGGIPGRNNREEIPSVGQDASTSSPGNSTGNSTDSAITHEVTIDLSNNKLDENSFEVGFIRLVPSLSITLDLTYNWIRFLPEDVFRPFFEVNSANRLQLMNNKFECGRCDSYWIIRNESLTRDRINVNCYMNSQNTVWNYDWSHCNNETENGDITSSSAPNGNGGANFYGRALVLVIQLLFTTVCFFIFSSFSFC